jgi:hypothetical protein
MLHRYISKMNLVGAAAIASVFGWMNDFACGLGGCFSDTCNTHMGMQGRLLIQIIFLYGEGVMILVFVNIQTLGGSIFCMIITSLLVKVQRAPHLEMFHLLILMQLEQSLVLLDQVVMLVLLVSLHAFLKSTINQPLPLWVGSYLFQDSFRSLLSLKDKVDSTRNKSNTKDRYNLNHWSRGRENPRKMTQMQKNTDNHDFS